MWSPISFPNEPRGWLGAVLLLTLACAREEAPTTDSAAAVPPMVQLPAPAETGSDTTCPKSGLWRSCSVLDRLEAAGLVITTQAEPARFPFFSIDGTTYTTSRSTIHVFLYADEASRRRDTAALDSAVVAPRNGTYSWPDPAVLVTSNNLAAVVVSPNERQSERIVLALSAGLPAARP